MKRLLAIMMLAAASLLAFEEVNILLDVNFEGEANAFPGMLGPWNVDSEDSLVNPMVVLKGEGPEADVLETTTLAALFVVHL